MGWNWNINAAGCSEEMNVFLWVMCSTNQESTRNGKGNLDLHSFQTLSLWIMTIPLPSFSPFNLTFSCSQRYLLLEHIWFNFFFQKLSSS